jgi:hypothetical protein
MIIHQSATACASPRWKPALPCVMTTHQQEDLPCDPRVLRAAAEQHRAKLGVFASIVYPGTVRIGDPIWLAV